MNKRIQQHAEQAGVVFPYGGFPNYDQFDLERFAESIVRECLSYAKDGDIDFMKFMIRQHFGVEP